MKKKNRVVFDYKSSDKIVVYSTEKGIKYKKECEHPELKKEIDSFYSKNLKKSQ